MKRFILFFLCMFIFAGNVLAADIPLPPAKPDNLTGESAPAEEMTLNQDNVKKLVETLESDTARTEFLTNLKTLLAEQEKQTAAKTTLPLSEQIGVRGFISDSAEQYESFLGQYNLSGSYVNQILGSVIVAAIAIVLLVLQKRGIKKLIRLADRLAAHLEVGVVKLKFYIRSLRIAGTIVILAVTIYTLAKIWGINAADPFIESAAFRAGLSNVVTVLLVVFIAALLWEAVNLYLAHILRQANTRNQTRAKTLLPIIRNIIVAVFVGLFGLVLLSELGINVTPLLAGAGVIGVAVGFGAQSFVKDFLTGFTIILEDLVRVGDVVNIAGVSGSVEKITMRKIQLRDFSGIVITIPYSEIKVIQNLTKDFSYYVMDIGVPYTQDVDRVISVLREIDESMRKDEAFSFMILEPLEIAGVDKFAEGAVVIKARIKTQPIRQWTVGREFNKRMKENFERDGIEMPLAQRTVNVRSLDSKALTHDPLFLERAAGATEV